MAFKKIHDIQNDDKRHIFRLRNLTNQVLQELRARSSEQLIYLQTGMENGTKTVVLFPFMAESHITSFLALARLIQRMGFTVGFINTPHNINKLRKALPPSSAVKLVVIPFHGPDHGLPPDSEDADSLPYSLIIRLLEASLSLKLPFRNLLRDLIDDQGGEKPVCVISDTFLGWVAEAASGLGVSHSIFSITGAFGLACYCSMWLNLPHQNCENVEFQLPDFPEAGVFHISQVPPALQAAADDDPFTDFQRRNFSSWSKTDALLLNTVEELEGTGIGYFRRKLGIPVWGIGPILLQEDDRAAIGEEPAINPRNCIEWLDKQEARSVIYISFGPQNTITASQMMTLAKALDATGRSFVWVVRPPLGFDVNAEFVAEQWLPEGFPRSARGLIVRKWAPQVEILSHKSVGTFLSHCGWKAVLESLKNGVPMIGWPMAAEQFYNAKLLAEIGAGVEVARGTSFEVRQEDIVEKIEMVIGENDKGREIRKKMVEIAEMFSEVSIKGMQEFFTAINRNIHEKLKT